MSPGNKNKRKNKIITFRLLKVFSCDIANADTRVCSVRNRPDKETYENKLIK